MEGLEAVRNLERREIRSTSLHLFVKNQQKVQFSVHLEVNHLIFKLEIVITLHKYTTCISNDN